jgi:hypothetical protein
VGVAGKLPVSMSPVPATSMPKDCNAALALAFLIAGAVIICSSVPAIAETPSSLGQTPDAAQQSDPEQQDPEYNGEDFTRPQRSFETRFLFQTSSGATSQTDRGSWLLRANWKSDLNAGWSLGLLGQVPFVDKTVFSPTGTDREFGIGDAVFQAALSHAIDQHWAFGFGARLVAPTAEDALGSGKWQIMPSFGVR